MSTSESIVSASDDPLAIDRIGTAFMNSCLLACYIGPSLTLNERERRPLFPRPQTGVVGATPRDSRIYLVHLATPESSSAGRCPPTQRMKLARRGVSRRIWNPWQGPAHMQLGDDVKLVVLGKVHLCPPHGNRSYRADGTSPLGLDGTGNCAKGSCAYTVGTPIACVGFVNLSRTRPAERQHTTAAWQTTSVLRAALAKHRAARWHSC